MGLGRRARQMFRIKTQHPPGQVDDPSRAFDLAYERQVQALQQLRASSAQLVASGKRLEVQVEQLKVRRDRLELEARTALAGGREDQAVQALTEAQPLDAQIVDLGSRVRQLGELRERLESSRRQMEGRVVTMRSQAETLRAQYGAAQAAVAAAEAVAGLGPRDAELELLVEQAQDKIAWTQARADAVGELLERGHLSPAGGSTLGGGDRLELSAAPEQVRSRLDQLKAELGPGQAPT
jgi:phage shock protein A